MDNVECVVIGAGVIGLAVARQLAQSGREVIVLEAAEGIGTVTSSRNSEVIHAGIYYKAGSLMARMCVAGKHALYRYCSEHGVPYKNCGKLIVATTPKETEKLDSIRAHAQANGVLDMKVLSAEEAHALEPALKCDAALLSPSTGIIDSHAYMLALRGDAEDAGAAFAFHTPLIRAKASAGSSTRAPSREAGRLTAEIVPSCNVERPSPMRAERAATAIAAIPDCSSTPRPWMPARSMPGPASLNRISRGRIGAVVVPAISAPWLPVAATRPRSSGPNIEAESRHRMPSTS